MAQQTGSLTGMVADASSGTPLPGANIGIPELPNQGNGHRY